MKLWQRTTVVPGIIYFLMACLVLSSCTSSPQNGHKVVDATATATAEQAERQAVINANSQLGDALSALKSSVKTLSSFSETSTLNTYANDWQQMQKDYATEQQYEQLGCVNYSAVQVEAKVVDLDDNSILGLDDSQLSLDQTQYNTDVSGVKNDIQTVQEDWAQLRRAVTNNTTGRPAPAYTSSDINNALQNAQNAEQAAKDTWQIAQSKASQYDQETSALEKQADALLANMHCS